MFVDRWISSQAPHSSCFGEQVPPQPPSHTTPQRPVVNNYSPLTSTEKAIVATLAAWTEEERPTSSAQPTTHNNPPLDAPRCHQVLPSSSTTFLLRQWSVSCEEIRQRNELIGRGGEGPPSVDEDDDDSRSSTPSSMANAVLANDEDHHLVPSTTVSPLTAPLASRPPNILSYTGKVFYPTSHPSSCPPVPSAVRGGHEGIASNRKEPTQRRGYQHGPTANQTTTTTAAHREVSPTAVVEFKMNRKLRFRIPLELMSQIQNGTYVVVQVDSTGVIDAGQCVQVFDFHERYLIPRSLGQRDNGSLLRCATPEDCKIINETLPQMEEHALSECHQLIHFLHLPFICVDAEYSFDAKCVKVFYSLAPTAETTIIPNISRLQRELSFKLGCKVILEQVRFTTSPTTCDGGN